MNHLLLLLNINILSHRQRFSHCFAFDIDVIMPATSLKYHCTFSRLYSMLWRTLPLFRSLPSWHRVEKNAPSTPLSLCASTCNHLNARAGHLYNSQIFNSKPSIPIAFFGVFHESILKPVSKVHCGSSSICSILNYCALDKNLSRCVWGDIQR